MKTKTRKNWAVTGNVFQALGGGASFTFVIISLMGVAQTQFPSVIGIDYQVTDTPFKVILLASIAMVAILSFLVAFIAKKQVKKIK